MEEALRVSIHSHMLPTRLVAHVAGSLWEDPQGNLLLVWLHDISHLLALHFSPSFIHGLHSALPVATVDEDRA